MRENREQKPTSERVEVTRQECKRKGSNKIQNSHENSTDRKQLQGEQNGIGITEDNITIRNRGNRSMQHEILVDRSDRI